MVCFSLPEVLSSCPAETQPAQEIRKMHSQVGLRLSQIQSYKEVRCRPQRSADGRLQDVTCYFHSHEAAPSSQQGFLSPRATFTEKEQIIIEFIWKYKRLQMAKWSWGRRRNLKIWQWHTKKQTYGSMEQNREPRNKSMFIWSINLQQRK